MAGESNPMTPANCNAKAVWRFEPLSEEIFRDMGAKEATNLRRNSVEADTILNGNQSHLPIGSICFSGAGSATDENILKPVHIRHVVTNKLLRVGAESGKFTTNAKNDSDFYDCFLDDAPLLNVDDEENNSFIFYVFSTESETVKPILNRVTTVRIQHKKKDRVLWISDIGDIKPELDPLNRNETAHEKSRRRSTLIPDIKLIASKPSKMSRIGFE